MANFLEAVKIGKNSWRRFLGGTVLVLMGWFIFGTILSIAVAGIFYFIWPEINLAATDFNSFLQNSDFWSYIFLTLSFIPFLATLLLVVKYLHQRSPKTLITIQNKINWKLLIQGFWIWFGLLFIAMFIEYLIIPETYYFSFQPKIFFLLLPIVFILNIIQTTTEELFFRGYLVQWGSLFSKNIFFLSVLSGIFFTLPHLGNPEISTGYLPMILIYFLMGVFFTFISIKKGSLELAIGVHIANNLFSVIVLHYANSAISTPTIITTTQFNPWVSLFTSIGIMSVFYFIIFYKKIKNKVYDDIF
jgi:membrane protease YdiL (CAAX protease family)